MHLFSESKDVGCNSRCSNLAANWLKSFLLPSDDRFILKQMPRLEVQSFLDFAPHYFTYITGAVQQKVAKILFHLEFISSPVHGLQNELICIHSGPQILTRLACETNLERPNKGLFINCSILIT